jgi:hypothetical protein
VDPVPDPLLHRKFGNTNLRHSSNAEQYPEENITTKEGLKVRNLNSREAGTFSKKAQLHGAS